MVHIAKSTHTHGASYLKNDNRVSGGKLEECDVKSCKHCQAIVKLNKVEHFCAKCESPICESCARALPMTGCVPFVKQVEQALELDYRRRQFRKIAGV